MTEIAEYRKLVARQRTEAEIKAYCEEWLAVMQKTGAVSWWARCNSGEVIIIRGKARYKVTLMPEGTADLLVQLPGLMMVWLETKRLSEKQTPAQVDFESTQLDWGALYYVVRDPNAQLHYDEVNNVCWFSQYERDRVL